MMRLYKSTLLVVKTFLIKSLKIRSYTIDHEWFHHIRECGNRDRINCFKIIDQIRTVVHSLANNKYTNVILINLVNFIK